MKKSPTGPAFTKDPLKNKSPITSNNKVFIADNSMNRLVCLRWISKPERKENFSFEMRVAPIRDQIYRELMYPPLQFHERSQYFIGAHDEPLSVAMYVLLALLAVVENGYDR
ncbi:MAG: hypothetical protein DME59_18375 [Verrucomicrobia bacterium]|nr:MAG: hypothetical protein DME59_18375 [Verrucomicrobiota bacterium]